jgi:hypothetical protein
MSKRELLPHTINRQVLALGDEPDAAKEAKLSADQQRQLDAIRGKLTEVEFKKLSDEDRENIELYRAELTKPDDERCQPKPETICAAVRDLWVAKTSSAPKSLICSDLRPSCHPLFLVPWPGPTPREQQFARHRPGFHERSAQACFCSFHEGSEAVRAERSQFSDGIRALRSLRPERRTGSGPHSEAGLDLALPSGSWPV